MTFYDSLATYFVAPTYRYFSYGLCGLNRVICTHGKLCCRLTWQWIQRTI